jgi:hypothetical protein
MKPPPESLVQALLRSDVLRCPKAHITNPSPVAHFYCQSCQELRCGLCVAKGVCVVCKAIVRSTGAILLRAKEHHEHH